MAHLCLPATVLLDIIDSSFFALNINKQNAVPFFLQVLMNSNRYGYKAIISVDVNRILLHALIFFGLLNHAHAETSVRITNGEWPPYLSEHLTHYGIVSRIITEAFELEGIKVIYGFYPWKRAFFLAEHGEWDGTAIWRKTSERDAKFYLSDPIVISKQVFFHRKDQPFEWRFIGDLKDKRIGATLSYDYGEEFESAEKSGTILVNRANSDELNFKMLLADRIDIFPIAKKVGYTLLMTQFSAEDAQRITHHPKVLKPSTLHLFLSKKIDRNKQLITAFNRGLKRLRESGKTELYLKEADTLE